MPCERVRGLSRELAQRGHRRSRPHETTNVGPTVGNAALLANIPYHHTLSAANCELADRARTPRNSPNLRDTQHNGAFGKVEPHELSGVNATHQTHMFETITSTITVKLAIANKTKKVARIDVWKNVQ